LSMITIIQYIAAFDASLSMIAIRSSRFHYCNLEALTSEWFLQSYPAALESLLSPMIALMPSATGVSLGRENFSVR